METGAPWIDCTLSRGPIRGKDRNTVGLILRVQARSEVEDFIRNLANSHTMPVDQYPGDIWTSVGNSERLQAYDVSGAIRSSGSGYTLEGVNGGLLVRSPEARALRNNGAEYDQVNLAFLTIVGLTNGITIGIPGAYSTDYVLKFRSMLPQAVKKFLADYLVPVTINLQVISRG